ncbi:CDP-glucose 4,6-dehydratase [Micromonospora echinospora]
MAESGLTGDPPAGRRPDGRWWTGRCVLVTGYSGFVGAWLTTTLLELGATVVGFALDDEHTRQRAAGLVERGATPVTGDIRRLADVRGAMATRPIDVVFHLAAQPLVGVGLADPHGTFTTNVQGTVNLLEAVREHQPGVLVNVTSDKCYRNQGWPWPYREVDQLGGGCPYSVSKAAAELVFEAYAELGRNCGHPTTMASVRFGNVIGGDDRAARRLVPDVVAALMTGTPLRLRRADAVRPWQHVLDVVQGLLLTAEALAERRVDTGEVFNFAPPDDGAPVRRLVAALTAAWVATGGTGVPVLDSQDAQLTEAEVLRLDGRKAANALGWRHRFDLDSASAEIIDWHRAVAAGVSPSAATNHQVRQYFAGVCRPLADQKTGEALR